MQFNDFFDMEIPQAALDLGFEDRSWHNDGAARMEYDRDGLRLMLWVSEPERELREVPEMPRFGLQLGSYLDDDYHWQDHTLLACETEEDLRAWFADLTPTPNSITMARVTCRAVREIKAAITSGEIPPTVRTFAELHDHCDANAFGGAFEDDAVPVTNIDFWNAVQDAAGQWLADNVAWLESFASMVEEEQAITARGVEDGIIEEEN